MCQEALPDMKHFRQTLHQPQLLFATLILTGILSLGADVTKAQGDKPLTLQESSSLLRTTNMIWLSYLHLLLILF
jgi:hypothetical protein